MTKSFLKWPALKQQEMLAKNTNLNKMNKINDKNTIGLNTVQEGQMIQTLSRAAC